MIRTGHEVSIAFALNIAAGAATILGGMVVFSKQLVYLANPVSLAVALSVSSGVMMFISFVEIFNESVHLLKEGIQTDTMTEETATGHSWLIATGSFAAGVALIYTIDVIVHKISPDHEMTELENFEDVRDSIRNMESSKAAAGKVSTPCVETGLSTAADPTSQFVKMDVNSQRALQRMGVLSALAIGIHNLPEGIATYVGAMQKPSVGCSLAIGIGLHNIPEGIAVAAPIYFATRSRWRGLMWCAISAAAEPVGGIIAWLAIGNGMDPISEGILFGLVSGVMVCICVKELIPTAYKFAKDKTYIVAIGTFAGMFVMMASLTLFGYAGA